MKQQLGLYDTNRLAELVSTYLNPKGKFTIYRKGEVSLRKAGIINRLLNIRDEESLDFLEVVQTIAEKLMAIKKGNPLVEVLCAEAVAEIVDSNDRKKIIEKLYVAHIADEELASKTIFESKGSRRHNDEQNIVIDIVEQPRVVRARVYDNISLKTYPSENLVNKLNSVDKVFVFGDK